MPHFLIPLSPLPQFGDEGHLRKRTIEKVSSRNKNKTRKDSEITSGKLLSLVALLAKVTIVWPLSWLTLNCPWRTPECGLRLGAICSLLNLKDHTYPFWKKIQVYASTSIYKYIQVLFYPLSLIHWMRKCIWKVFVLLQSPSIVHYPGESTTTFSNQVWLQSY